MLLQACMRAGAWRAFAPFRPCYVRPQISCLAQRPDFTQPSQSGKTPPGVKPGQNRRDAKSAPKAPATDEKQRLSKVLAAAGVASRRACEELIHSGVVKVNGKLVMEQVLVDPSKDQVEVKGKKVDIHKAGQQMYYFVVNKPKGYICSNVELTGKEGKRAVDLLQPWLDEWIQQNKGRKGALPPRLFPVGRLDVATTGLLLLTNDGAWANKVIHPSSGLTKEYLVLVDKAPSKAQVNQMMRGVEIDGVLVQPEEVSLLEESVRLRIVVSEGKKHEGQGPGRTAAARIGSSGSSPPGGNSSDSGSSASSGSSSASPGSSSGSLDSSSNTGSSGQRPLHTSSGAPAASNATAAAPSTPLEPEPASTQPPPRFDSWLLEVEQEGVRMWLWNSGLWRMSQAMAARDKADAQRTAQQRQYRGGPLFRAPKLKWWADMPYRQPPAPPSVFTPEEWSAQQRAAAEAQQGDAAAWAQQAHVHASLPLRYQAATSFPEGAGHDDPAARDVSSAAPPPAQPGRAGLGRYRRRQWFARQLEMEAAERLQAAAAGAPTARAQAQSSTFRGSTVRGSSSQLLDPAMFDPVTGALLPEARLKAVQAALQASELRAARAAQKREQQRAREYAAQVAELERALVCRDDADWQIRVLVSSVGLEVLALKRTRVGGYRLPRTLKLGQYSALTAGEVRRVTDMKEQAALAPKIPNQQVQPKQPTVRGVVIPTDLQDI